MPNFSIHLLNSTAEMTTVIQKAMSEEEASAMMIRSGVDMAADEVVRGATAASVVVTLIDGSGKSIDRAAVTISVAPLSL